MDTQEAVLEQTTPLTSNQNTISLKYAKVKTQVLDRLSIFHGRIPYIRRLPLSALLIISFLILVNLIVWAICGFVLVSHTSLLSTAALAYTLGLRHALDADHISAIDLMTRRLIATGQRPVTVGTFFSLGHSTIVIITSIIVAATAAGVSKHFDGFSNVGGIIGTSVSAVFLILLGIMNAYILYKLVVQLQKVIRLQPEQEAEAAWNVEGGGFLFRVLRRMFKLINRPWKMYPLGVLFGLGFDTSSEVALLGISSIQGANGTSIWLILVFPILFTSGMCLVDTIDGALMMSLYIAPMGISGDNNDKKGGPASTSPVNTNTEDMQHQDPQQVQDQADQPQSTNNNRRLNRAKDPLTFLYYSIILTTLTVICAIIIGILQLLTLILNVATPTGKFWNGVQVAGDNYDIIGGSICASFIFFGGLSVLCYKPWRRRIEAQRARLRIEAGNSGDVEHEEVRTTSSGVLPDSSRMDIVLVDDSLHTVGDDEEDNELSEELVEVRKEEVGKVGKD